jgi:filamentous hemagglutinin family protein
MTPTVDQINGGATRGTNLFHSFQEFNVGEGRSAYFTNPAGIENILTRVTGTNPSNILGTLGVTGGNANLFLINPNGIIFGQNARLDVGGSFLASTASSLNFADGTQFSATAPQTTPLLTVSVPIGLQFGTTAGSIRNEPQAANSSEEIVGLQVQPGKTLALVGGDVSLDGGKLQAPGGRVELAGVAESGTVGLNVDGNNLGLSFADGVALSDVSLTNGAEVNVRAGGGGSIAINARNLNISGASTRVRAGIDSGLGSVDSMAGDIEIKATEAINIDASVISNVVLGEGVGNGGNINITTGSLRVSNGAVLNASTFGQGNAGSVNINARDTVSFDGVDSAGFPSGAASIVGDTAGGNGGNINITAGSLSLTDGTRLSASTFGKGNAGSVNINARNTVSFDGGYAASFVGETGVGDGGNINITAGSLSVTNGAQLVAVTEGQGNAGSVNINARDTVSFDGGYAASFVGETGVGDGGNINITAGSLSLTDGAQLAASTFGVGNSGSIFLQADESVSLARNSAIFSKVEAGGVGNGGDINITAGSLSLTDGAQLQTFVANWRTEDPVVPVGGYGNAGDVNINVRDTITLVGKEKDSGASLTAIITGVGVRAVGNGGNINIRARELSLTNAQLGSDTRGQGRAGDITIQVVDSIYLTNTDNVLEGIRRSRIGSAVAPDAEGNAGDIDIQARSLFLNNGSVLDATTQGNGNAGDIRVSANTLTATNGGQILTTSRSSFHAGTISLDITDSVTLSGSDPNFAQRKTRSEPGTVIILDSPASGVFADTSGGGGNINLQTGDLILRRGSSISTNARGLNITGGNITIYTDNLVAVPKEDSDISANAENSFGGRVIINAQGIFGTQFREHPTPLSDITATSALGPQFNGVVQLNTPGIDPSRGLTNLPTEVVDASNQIAQTCGTRGAEARKNEFIVTGRRGLPSNPYEMLSNEQALEDIHPPSEFSSSRNSKPDAAKTVTSQSATSNPKPPIVEAQGWVINDKGQVVLTATASSATPHNSLPASATCPSS